MELEGHPAGQKQVQTASPEAVYTSAGRTSSTCPSGLLFPVAVCEALPVRGVSMLLWNSIAWGKINTTLETLESAPFQSASSSNFSKRFPSCAVTRVRTRKKLGQMRPVKKKVRYYPYVGGSCPCSPC